MRLGKHEEQQLGSRRFSWSLLRPGKEQIIESQNSRHPGGRTGQWIGLALCTAVLTVWILEKLVTRQPDQAQSFAPDWLPLAAAGFAAAGIMQPEGSSRWLRLRGALRWTGLLLMVWVANGLPFDLLTMAGLIGDPATGLRIGVNWPGLATRTLALAVAVMLGRLALALPAAPVSTHTAAWYGYAAFALALPYPILRTWWALGGTLGLAQTDGAGHGFVPWLACIPWLMAAVLSLLLVSQRRWMPRRLMLVAGWSATAIVAMIGPAACWSLVTKLMEDGDLSLMSMSAWVPCLFYGSWFLWAIAAGAATRSYQLRSAVTTDATVA